MPEYLYLYNGNHLYLYFLIDYFNFDLYFQYLYEQEAAGPAWGDRSAHACSAPTDVSYAGAVVSAVNEGLDCWYECGGDDSGTSGAGFCSGFCGRGACCHRNETDHSTGKQAQRDHRCNGYRCLFR